MNFRLFEDFIDMITAKDFYHLNKNIDSWKKNINRALVISHTTPLIIACMSQYNDPKIVELLLKNGADPNIRNNYGDYPLHNAIKILNRDLRMRTINLLLQYNADVNIAKFETKIILQTIIQNKYKLPNDECIEMIELLLNNKYIDINIHDCDGETPLMAACSFDNLEIVELLLKYGADPNIKDDDGSNALAYLGDGERNEETTSKILFMLLDYGINPDEEFRLLERRNKWSIKKIREYRMIKKYEQQITEYQQIIAEYEKNIGDLQRENEELRHRPGNPGYAEAFEHFNFLKK